MSLRLRILGEEEIRAALPMDQAVEAMGAAFASLSTGGAVMPRRMLLPVTGQRASVLLKPALVPGEGLGAKLVSVFPGNAERGRPAVSGLVVLLDPVTGEPAALMDGTFLTAWRTGAASGLATRLLARPEARVAGIFGCGAQARTQLLALDAVRDLAVVKVFARTPEAVARFVEEMSGQVRAQIRPAASPVDAVKDADIVCTATTSATPVFDGRRLINGCHVNGVGSYQAAARELDRFAVERSRVFVDSLSSARTEAGDLIQAAEEGATRPEEWIELGRVAAGHEAGRRSEREITLFKSVGVAVQDVVAAGRVLAKAEESGAGRVIEI